MKKGFAFGLVSLLGAAALVGCAKTEEKVTVSKLKMSGVSVAYKEGSSIDWDALSVLVTYSDQTTKTFTHFEYDVDSVSKTETEAVIYTQGLHAQSALAEGSYKIKFADASNLGGKYDLATITVGTATSDKFALTEFNEPSLKTAYKNNVKDAGTDIEVERNDRGVAKAHENLFISSETQYVVGTMNPFIYEPEISFESLENPTAPVIPGDQIYFRKSWEVKKLVSTEYVKVEKGTDYDIVGDYVQFKDSAIGGTYSLKVSLTDFETVEGSSTKAESVFEGFRVEKGLNIYSAKQLGILNVTNLTYQQQIDQGIVEHGGRTSDVFYNGTSHYSPDLDTLWTNYLKDKVYSEAELNAYADVKAIFLHNNISLTKDDLPSEYFIAKDEFTNNAREGNLRDGVPLYAPIVGNEDVEINGNFWTLDTSDVPLCKCTWSGGFHPYVDESEPIMPGHTPVIKFCGVETANYEQEQKQTVLGKGVVRNINSIGNTGTDLKGNDFEKMLTLTGLIFVKNDYCGADYDNLIVKQYQIGLFTNHCVGQIAGDDFTTIENTRVYDCANSGIFNYHNGGTLVSKSVFNRFGGAPLMNAAGPKDYEGCNSKFTADVIFNNEITGEEVYFAALGPDIVANVNHIKGWNSMFETIGNNFYYQITDEKGNTYKVLNLVGIGLNGDDYHKADSREFYSNIMLNYGETNQLNAQVKSETEQWSYFNDFYNSVYKANYDAAYAKAYPVYYQQQYDAAYPVELEKAAIAYIIENHSQFPGVEADTDPADIPQKYIDMVKTDPTFVAGFKAQFDVLFKAQFDAQFPAQFKAIFDPQFDEKFPKSAYGNAVPPVFQTEVADELFWTDDQGHLYDRLGGTFSTQLEGEYLSILLPVGSTCFNLIFRISKIA